MAWSGSPTATRSPPPPASSSSSSTCAGSVSWYSSTNSQPGPLALLAQQLRVGRQLGDRGADQLGRVVARGVTAAGGGEGGDRLVLLLEGRGVHPRVVPQLAAPGGEHVGADAALGRAQQQLAQLGAEPRGGQRRGQRLRPADRALLGEVAAQQLGDDGVLLGGGEQPRRRLAAQQRRPAQHAVGVGVERAGQRLADGARDPGGDPGAQLGGGLAAEGEDEDLLGVDAAVDARGDRLDDRRRLPGAGTGEHQQRPARVVDHRLLGRVQPRPGRRRRLRLHEPVDRLDVPPHCHTPMEARGADSSGRAAARQAASDTVSAAAAAVPATVRTVFHRVHRRVYPAHTVASAVTARCGRRQPVVERHVGRGGHPDDAGQVGRGAGQHERATPGPPARRRGPRPPPRRPGAPCRTGPSSAAAAPP